MMSKHSKNIQLVLDVLRDEVDGDVVAALKKITPNYTMTWVYKSGKTLFPSTKRNIREELEEAYPIKGRSYQIQNIAEGKDVVMVELIESYPDPKTNKMYRTPLVLVLEVKKGKIETGRHYCDPQLSHSFLSPQSALRAYKGKKKKPIVIK